MYGAMGIAVGMLLSEVLVLLFVFVIYRGSMAGRREAESGMKGTDSFSLQLRTLLIPMGGDILRDMFLLLPLWIGLLFFQKRSTDIYASVSAYGIFVGRYLITILMPVAILSAGILPGWPEPAAISAKRRKICQNCISGRSTGDGGTWILFHGRDRGTGNTTVTGFG